MGSKSEIELRNNSYEFLRSVKIKKAVTYTPSDTLLAHYMINCQNTGSDD
jgi:hypothetical protein